jgi:sugar lactone lactonase YvrE
MADAGDVAAELRLGDFYHEQKGALPLIDTRGRQIHRYRLAADRARHKAPGKPHA